MEQCRRHPEWGGLLSLVGILYTNPHRYGQRFVSYVVLNPANFATQINLHKELKWQRVRVFSWNQTIFSVKYHFIFPNQKCKHISAISWFLLFYYNRISKARWFTKNKQIYFLCFWSSRLSGPYLVRFLLFFCFYSSSHDKRQNKTGLNSPFYWEPTSHHSGLSPVLRVEQVWPNHSQ